jgi:hypothetical protein
MTLNQYQSSQKQEDYPQTLVEEAGVYTVQYAYARAKEKQQPDKVGEDYLRVVADGQRLAFALCDGVSTSFLAAQGAKILGDGLVKWLWNDQFFQEPVEKGALNERARKVLSALAREATNVISEFVIPEDIGNIRRRVLEQKKVEGSRCVFVSGLIDLVRNQVVLLWMGDARLRIWGSKMDRVHELSSENFQLTDHWTSIPPGVVGKVHTLVQETDSIYRLVAYSDGLACLDAASTNWPDLAEIKKMMHEQALTPQSDDISLIEITFPGKPADEIRADMPLVEQLPSQGEEVLTPEPTKAIPEAEDIKTDVPPVQKRPKPTTPKLNPKERENKPVHKQHGGKKTVLVITGLFVFAISMISVILFAGFLIGKLQPDSTATATQTLEGKLTEKPALATLTLIQPSETAPAPTTTETMVPISTSTSTLLFTPTETPTITASMTASETTTATSTFTPAVSGSPEANP